MALSPEERASRKRDRMIEKAKEMSLGTYSRKFVAACFQKMIRAEAAAEKAASVWAVNDGVMIGVYRKIGECVCVTCGKVGPWKGSDVGGGPIETGHFVASRAASILFEETNAHPQCKHCNQHLGGNEGNYTIWMQHVYGQHEIDRLRRLKATTRQFTRGELVDMRIRFQERLKATEETMKEG